MTFKLCLKPLFIMVLLLVAGISEATTEKYGIANDVLDANFGYAETVSVNPSESDSLALVAVYNALDGDNWHSFFQWDLNQPMETWRGITLNENGCVDAINISGGGASGALAPEISNLSEVRRISVQNSKISGTIPTSIGDLTNLEVLDLSRNQLTSLPATIGDLTNLKELNLSFNQLTSLPVTIGNLTNLKELDLGYNRLTSIPITIGDLTKLEYLRLLNNRLTSIPTTIGNLTNLWYLHLSNNQLTSIPTTISNLANLWHLYLINNQLTSLPATIGDLAVGYLHLSNNQLTDIPTTIGDLPRLITLSLNNNQLTDLPATIGDLTNLKSLSLNNNQLTDLPTTIGDLTNLKSLYLNSNQLTDIPTTINDLTNLKSLYLSNNQLVALPFMGDLDLERFHINDNQITGSMPEWLADMELRSLKMANNQFSGCYDSSLSELCNEERYFVFKNEDVSDGNNFDAAWEDFCDTGAGGCDLEPANCQETDSLALVAVYEALNGDDWFSFYQWDLTQPMSTWRYVTLNDNGCVDKLKIRDGSSVNGTIAPEIGDLSEITELDLSENSVISGTIPASIGNLTNLVRLNLGHNELTGTIPASISNLTNLENLNLSRNELTGSIPSSFNNLTNLQYLSLSDNNLTGSIPASLSDLNELIGLTIRNNQLSGCYDSSLSDLCSGSPYMNNYNISWGNNFDADWEDFCSTGLGGCNNKVDQSTAINTSSYPNPFTLHTTITYTLPTDGNVTLIIHNASGKEIAILEDNETKTAGAHSAIFEGNLYPAGMYYYTIQAGEYNATQKMILIK